MQAIQNSLTSSSIHTVPVAIYTRVSTTSQVGGRFDSCESQAAICREHLAKRASEGWHEVACFTDAAYSGATLNRPGMHALKRQIEMSLVKVVLIFKLERVLRSTDEWGPFRSFLQKHGCRLVSTTEDLTEDTPSGRLKNNLLVSVAEYERLNTAEKVRAKMLAQAKRGLWNYGAVPYGYDYDSAKQVLREHPAEAAIVRRIFEQAAHLVSLRDIAEALNNEGLRTRVRTYRTADQATRTVGGARFRTDTLRSIIRNPIVRGKVRFQGTEYAGQHPALVSEDIWERASAAAGKVVRESPWRLRPSDKHFHLLKGTLFCGACGRAMVPHANGNRDAAGKRYRYYTCGKLYREREPGACGVGHLSARGIERVVISFLGEIHRHPAILDAAVEASRLRKRDDREPLRVRAAKVERELADLGRKLRNCVDAIAEGGADLLGGELRERAVTLRDCKHRLLVEQEQIRQDLLACDADCSTAERLRASLERFSEVFGGLEPQEQKTVFGVCVDRIDLRRVWHGGRDADNVPAYARTFELQLKLSAAQLVDGMAQQVVVQRRGEGPTHRPLVLVLRTAIGTHGYGAILAPFVREVGAPRKLRAAPTAAHGEKHCIHQAAAWRRQLDAAPRTTIGAFARVLGVSRATLDFHLLLLRLGPTIRRFLEELSEPAAIRHFGMIRMGVIARKPAEEQMAAFASLCEQWQGRPTS